MEGRPSPSCLKDVPAPNRILHRTSAVTPGTLEGPCLEKTVPISSYPSIGSDSKWLAADSVSEQHRQKTARRRIGILVSASAHIHVLFA